MTNLMIKLCICVQTLTAREEGQDLVEYALVVALIAFGALVGIQSFSGAVYFAFLTVSSDLGSAMA